MYKTNLPIKAKENVPLHFVSTRRKQFNIQHRYTVTCIIYAEKGKPIINALILRISSFTVPDSSLKYWQIYCILVLRTLIILGASLSTELSNTCQSGGIHSDQERPCKQTENLLQRKHFATKTSFYSNSGMSLSILFCWLCLVCWFLSEYTPRDNGC